MTQCDDVVIIGGGAIGLATAIQLAEAGVSVTVLSRNSSEAALYAAAGMLAPQAERIESLPMLELCLQSRDLYPTWTQALETRTGLSCDYWPCGILCPEFNPKSADLAKDYADAIFSEQDWLDPSSFRQKQPGLSDQVMGGYYFPQDAQVDNRKLGVVLHQAAKQLNVTLIESVTVTQLVCEGDRVQKISTTQGDWSAQTYLLTAGAWSGQLLNIPVAPRKGQMLMVSPPEGYATLELNHVLFGPEVYIVPRRSGKILIGATSEMVGFRSQNTVSGIQFLLNAATRMVPEFEKFVVQEQWWGFRPSTPDDLPILGQGPYRNLALATGHFRNGILLSPITAKIITDWILSASANPLLDSFRWDRVALRLV